MQRMAEPVTTGIAITFKGYLLPAFAILTGSIAHALQEVKKKGWKGWASLIADIFIAMVAGNVLYQFILIWNPEYSVFSAAIGGYLGPNSVKFLVHVIKSYKTND